MSNKCNQKCEVWSRCVGYYSPRDKTNLGKYEEILERKMYKVNIINMEVVEKQKTDN